MKRRALLALLCAAALGLPAQGHAAGYPEKSITIIVPFVAGGSSDIVGRLTGQKLAEKLGQNVIIDNRPGANGGIGANLVAKAKPDGYTLLVGSIGVYSINPALFKDLNYDPARDMDLLSLAVRTPNVLVANPKFPANTVAELIAHMKKQPGQVTFASSGIGSSDHLTAVLFWQKTGTTGVHVPYKGGAAAMNDMIGGHADVSFQNLGAASGHVKAGRLKILGVTSEKRHPVFPDTPTMSEAGVQGLEVYSWQAFAGPKGLPRDVMDKLQPALVAALKDPEVAKKFDEIGFEVVANSPKEFADFQAAEVKRWKEVIEKGNIKPES
ncbi:MAG TPA: tripartite tricarboxylate transporter substrate binding protein [Alphaproteobacteria bacterium]|nr:tripartite tricarboxylate transporter substrate binding protein [Alphaproteobacteria bacterium]